MILKLIEQDTEKLNEDVIICNRLFVITARLFLMPRNIWKYYIDW